MSHWGATVITNLFTAIPLLGQPIAEFITTSLYLNISKIINKNINLIKIERSINNNYYKNISESFLGMFTGLIDGDGYIYIGNPGDNSIKIALILSLHTRDLPLLEYIKSTFKLGTITTYPKQNTSKYIIYKTDLQEIIFPLLKLKNIFFLTKTRNDQYNKAIYILENNITKYDKIPTSLIFNKINTIPDKPENYLKLAFFKNWLVGFTIADGSFFIKHRINRSPDVCFSLKQRIHLELFNAFKLLFDTKIKLYIEKEKYIQFNISSKKDIQKIINFFSFENNHSLYGYRAEQYKKWIKSIKKIKRYKELKLPNIE